MTAVMMAEMKVDMKAASTGEMLAASKAASMVVL